jgi:hypothetical protein
VQPEQRVGAEGARQPAGSQSGAWRLDFIPGAYFYCIGSKGLPDPPGWIRMSPIGTTAGPGTSGYDSPLSLRFERWRSVVPSPRHVWNRRNLQHPCLSRRSRRESRTHVRSAWFIGDQTRAGHITRGPMTLGVRRLAIIDPQEGTSTVAERRCSLHPGVQWSSAQFPRIAHRT